MCEEVSEHLTRNGVEADARRRNRSYRRAVAMKLQRYLQSCVRGVGVAGASPQSSQPHARGAVVALGHPQEGRDPVTHPKRWYGTC